MMTREFQGGRFGFADHRFHHFRENWAKMSAEEKVKLIDERMESMSNSKFFKAFMGEGFKHPFGEKWAKMTPEEKAEFIDKRSKHFNGSEQTPQALVAAIDERCEEWMKKSPEEKEAAVKERFEHSGEMSGRFNFWGKGH